MIAQVILFIHGTLYAGMASGLVVCRRHKRSDLEDIIYIGAIVLEMALMFGTLTCNAAGMPIT